MTQLTFEITNQLINRTDQFKPVADSKNYLYAHFTFLTEDWTGKVATAIFTKDEKSFIMLLDSNNECLVPWELIKDGGDIYVSVYGGDINTVNKSRVTIYESGYVEDAENSEPPTPNIYAQILESISEIQTGLNKLKEDLLIIDGGSTENWDEGE